MKKPPDPISKPERVKRPAKGGWRNSKKFRWQAEEMFQHLLKQEAKWRKVVEAKVKTYTPDEVVAFAQARGLPVADSVKMAAGRKT